jgi:hypothetical protein
MAPPEHRAADIAILPDSPVEPGAVSIDGRRRVDAVSSKLPPPDTSLHLYAVVAFGAMTLAAAAWLVFAGDTGQRR